MFTSVCALRKEVISYFGIYSNVFVYVQEVEKIKRPTIIKKNEEIKYNYICKLNLKLHCD